MKPPEHYTAGSHDVAVIRVFQYLAGRGIRECTEVNSELRCESCDANLANEGITIKVGHKCWQCQTQVTRFAWRTPGSVMTQVFPVKPPHPVDFYGQSVLLNSILWRMALHLGDAKPGDTSIDAEIEDLADRFFKKLDTPKITHVVAGDDQWEPTPEQLAELIEIFKEAENDPLGSLLVTRASVVIKQEDSEHDSVLRYKASRAPKT